jgi:hypothetical protein
VTGDVPALGRLIVTDTATQSRRHVEWGLEGPLTYNSATSLLVDSDNMVTTGFAGRRRSRRARTTRTRPGNNVDHVDAGRGRDDGDGGTGNLSRMSACSA